MQFNITPQELDGMIQRLRQWSHQITSIRNSMHGYTQNLRQTWRDPQFDSYLSHIEMLGKTMGLNAGEMEQLAKTLTVLKNNLERTQQEYQNMIRQRPQ
jgi:uncharacterized protein YukE